MQAVSVFMDELIMNGPRYPGFDTLSLHAGASPDSAAGASATPVYFSAAFALGDAEHAASLFNMERGGHVESGTSNPTVAVLEERIAALEGGVAGIATASGQAALHLALATILGAGSHIVASRALDGPSHDLLAYTLKRFGVATTFVDPRDIDAWRAAIRPETRVLFGESLGNPGLAVLDIPRVAELAHEHELPLLVDASLATPWLQKPFDQGADLVFHSATGFLCGHGSAVGGLLVDGGSFDWQRAFERSGRFAELCEPWEGLHGMVFTDESPVAAFALRARREGLRSFGAAMSPHNAFAILQGIETLGLRMERHVANTRRIVEFLARHPAVESVSHPELENHPDHALAGRLLGRGCGAVFPFTLHGGRPAARRFIDGLKLFSHLASVGDAKSLAIHPASTTHLRVPADQLAQMGILEGTIRLSVGLEDPDDLIEDLGRALKLAQKGG
jgi:O-acetylhomoserine (thiol)-lyase